MGMTQGITAGFFYEVRLSGGGQTQLVFVTCKAADQDAIAFADRLLTERQEYTHAEVWRGMDVIARLGEHPGKG